MLYQIELEAQVQPAGVANCLCRPTPPGRAESWVTEGFRTPDLLDHNQAL